MGFINYEQTLRETLIETLVPEDESVVGYMTEDMDLQEIGFWIIIDGKPVFLGKSFKASIFTAKQGDWVDPERDGTIDPGLISWFEERATRGVVWEEYESQQQRNERRTRIAHNTELTTSEVPRTPPHQELDYGEPVSPEELKKLLDNPQKSDPVLLKEFEVLKVAGRKGYWLLDENLDALTRVRLRLEETGYVIQKLNTIDAVDGMELRRVALLKCTKEEEFISFRYYGEGTEENSEPILELKRTPAQTLGLQRIFLE